MKKFNKSLLALSIPFAALVLTSCNGAAKQIEYFDALDYASEHFDEYALDAVPCAYEIKINKIYIDLTFEADIVGHLKEDFRAGFEGINVIHNNVYAAHINSGVIESLQTYFGDLKNFFISYGAEDLLDLNYYIDNQEMLMKLESSTSGSVLNLLPRLFGGVMGALRVAKEYHGYTDPSSEDVVVQKEDSSGKVIETAGDDKIGFLLYEASNYLNYVGMLLGKYIPLTESFGIDFINYYGLSVDQSISGSEGEKLDLAIKTDKYGFMKTSHFAVASTEFDIAGNAYNYEFGSDTPQNKDPVTKTHGGYKYSLRGSFDIDVEVNTIFKD